MPGMARYPGWINVRVTPEVEGRMRQLAALHGRTLSAELRLAFACHDARSTLRYLDSEAGQRELGDELPAAREKVLADVEEFEQAATELAPVAQPSLN
jgi:hypothetical protein